MTKNPYDISEAITLIKTFPRRKGGATMWRTNVNATSYVVATILTDPDPMATLSLIAEEAGVSAGSLTHMIHGNATGVPWKELRKALTARGVQWLRRGKEAKREAEAAERAAQKAAKEAESAGRDVAETVASVRDVAADIAATAMADGTTADIRWRDDYRKQPRDWKLDHETGDIIVTITTRLAYGTPEHREKWRAILPMLGT